ncbi:MULTISPECIES: lysine N(6)-hydroxylase/L-ornithine N(5)-oxygenase family protein [unclassified Streptomyces]|uniref:lysine N(6)-hydroxylase/L-ornithine N(5)-oxygenase family protein n=1 Tax=Streptomyces sp. NPDC127532 TaxID=3345399 RepID=UPI003643C145
MAAVDHADNAPYDLVGVGLGPFNLALAALADSVPGFRPLFLHEKDEFRWHRGMMIKGTTVQMPFIADLVTLVEPTSRWSFLAYLKHIERLFPFYFAEQLHIRRAEYDAYCRWVSRGLESCRFGYRVTAVAWDASRRAFEVTHSSPSGGTDRCWARNVALGLGTEPAVPAPLRSLASDTAVPVAHSADYLSIRDQLVESGDVTVIGSGQSGAEVFLDLLRRRPPGAERLRWLARTQAFAPMEYSKLGLEHFTPDYTRYFFGLPERARDRLVPAQWQLYKAVSATTLGDIQDELYGRSLHGGWPDVTLTPGADVTGAQFLGDRILFHVRHADQGRTTSFETGAAVLATGYTERPNDALLAPLEKFVQRDERGRLKVDIDYRAILDESVSGSLFLQNAERHTHGVGAPDLGLAAWRGASILNALCQREVFQLPNRSAFTRFGLPAENGTEYDGSDPEDSAQHGEGGRGGTT